MTWWERMLLRKVAREMLDQIRSGKLGWKTLAGIGVIVASVALQAVGWLSPEQADGLTKVGEALTGFGLRDAIAKLRV